MPDIILFNEDGELFEVEGKSLKIDHGSTLIVRFFACSMCESVEATLNPFDIPSGWIAANWLLYCSEDCKLQHDEIN